MRRRVWGLIRKEFIQFFRDKALVVLVFYTFLEIAICGWALSLEVRDMPAAVFDGDHSAESRDLIATFARLDNFNLIDQVDDSGALDAMMQAGRIQYGLVIPAGYGRQLAAGTPTEVQVLVDGSNSSLAGQALAITADLTRDLNTQVTLARVERSGLGGHAAVPQVNNAVRMWYMPQLKYVHFVMLTMLTISVLVLGVLLPAASIVREKDAGTFEQLMVTPIRASELIAAKTLPMIALKLVGLTIGIGMSLWLFDVPLHGDLALFYAISLLMFLASMGIGVLIGTFAQNMQQTLLIGFFLFFPLAFLSGTMVPVTNMPPFLQWLTVFSPLRYYVDVTLGIFLKGVGLEVLWPQALALAALAVVLLGIGALRLRRSLA